MDGPTADGATRRWWPELRRVDGVGLALVLCLVVWVWWASRAQGGDGGPLIGLLLAAGALAALARWLTFFHGTATPGLVAVGVLLYAIVAAGDGAGPDLGGSSEAAGALLATGTAAAAMVVLRARALPVRLVLGIVAVALAIVTWRTGSVVAIAVVVTVLVATVAFLTVSVEERRWAVVWPVLIAVLLLFGTLAYAAVPLPDGLLLGQPDEARVAGWSAGLDAVTGSPLYGTGPGVVDAERGADAGASGWARHEPLEVAAETGLLGGLLLLALLWWLVVWIARPGGGPGSVVAAVAITGSIAHASLAAIWHAPAVPLTLAALAGAASLRGGDAAWRLRQAWDRIAPQPPASAKQEASSSSASSSESRSTAP